MSSELRLSQVFKALKQLGVSITNEVPGTSRDLIVGSPITSPLSPNLLPYFCVPFVVKSRRRCRRFSLCKHCPDIPVMCGVWIESWGIWSAAVSISRLRIKS